jgi:hypothetical protein
VVTGGTRAAIINAGRRWANDAMRLYTAANGWFLRPRTSFGTIEEG